MPQPVMLTNSPQPEVLRNLGGDLLGVTVIVPMRNEERRIGSCLDSILANNFDLEQLEILVVDGGSTDGSRDIVMDRAARFGGIHLLDNPAKIVSAGLNVGIRHARGRVIIIMGAHAEYSSNYIRTCVEQIEASKADAVGGVLETRPGGNSVVAQSIALMSQHPFGVGGSAFRTRQQSGYVDTVPYGAYRREVFEDVGLFNENLTRNQDFEFNARLHNLGGKLFLSADIRAVYYNVGDFPHLVKQAFNNGYWLPAMWFASPSSARLRHAVPATFAAVLLASLVLAPFNLLASMPGLFAIALYAIAVTAAAGQIAWRYGVKLFIPLIAVFFTQHILYGTGTLTGLLSCARRSQSFPRPQEAKPTATL